MRIDFNMDDVPQNKFEPIPEGTYTAQLTNCEHVTSQNDPSNAYWKCTLTIVEGPHANRLLFDNLNIYRGDNPSVDPSLHREPTQGDITARAIAIGRLLEYKNAHGIEELNDTDEMVRAAMSKPITVRVGITHSQQFGDQNVVKKVMPYKIQ
jgi:hypothetical protein